MKNDSDTAVGIRIGLVLGASSAVLLVSGSLLPNHIAAKGDGILAPAITDSMEEILTAMGGALLLFAGLVALTWPIAASVGRKAGGAGLLMVLAPGAVLSLAVLALVLQ